MTTENSYINAIISTNAKYHGVSPEGLLEAWNEMEQHKDICYAKTADDIINALGFLADYIEKSFIQTDNPRSRYQVLKQIIWENSERENRKEIAQMY